jgi:glycolate oxidase
MNEQTLWKLRKIVGTQYVLTSPEDILCYGYDAQRVECRADAVARPKAAEEIAEILRLANEENFAVVPRGAGTGLSGGSVPSRGGVVLDLCRMNHILEIDQENLMATVEPAVITADLHTAVEAVGLMYPPDPGSMKVSTIGGNVAENSGGLRAVKYGVTKDYLISLEGVSPTGELFTAGARTMKSVAGYDLARLMCGSEGTLGVFTKIVVKLIPLPKHRRTVMASFKGMEDAARAVSGIIAAGIMPATLELMDGVTVRAIEDYKKLGLPVNAGALLLFEADGVKAQVEEEAAGAIAVMKEHGAFDIQSASDPAERDRIWEGRRAALGALARVRPTTILEDATVPRSRLAEMVAEINAVGRRHSLMIGTFGHAGDGNLHPTILANERNPHEMARVEKAVREIFDAALRLGGTVSGEHGIGLTKTHFLPIEAGSGAIEMMRAIKSALDPRGILNPGKIFEDRERGSAESRGDAEGAEKG